MAWKDDVGPLLGERCQSCHAGTTAAGNYDLTSYQGALGPGTDSTPDVIAGDAQSQLLTTIDPDTANATHASFADVFTKAEHWVVDCQASFVNSSIHRPGILDPASPDFHGQLLREQKYDFAACQKCHGDDFGGGTSKVSCLSCHKEGPTACSTCHGDIAKSGSHGHHLGGGPLAKTYACTECHKVPATYKDPGHIFLADGTVDPAPAEVILEGMAAATPAGFSRAAPPAYDAETKSCTNVYCHGGVLGDTAASQVAPSWKAAGQGQAECGTCHGLPPRNAGSKLCSSCHPSVVDDKGEIKAPTLHIDGVVELSDASKGCAGCHGKTMDGAPPPDLSGQTAATAPGVGAHQAHLQAKSHLRGPIACVECHLVPTEVGSTGHFSGHAAAPDPVAGAEVFPVRAAGSTPTLLGSADGANPQWSPTTATCSSVYCHGGGTKLSGDATAGLERSPAWTAQGPLACGTACHGAPPTLAPHLPTMLLTDCATCHTRTVDPTGQIIVAGPVGAETSNHMNGAIDVAP